ncbi:AGE family epimerase/isomerase [Thalassotalea mangrovi]|uniref:Mannose-6-phosphate isomerase n=1 Tax=Thalassotalea mangrovi TaxID=2572245 RepID=A0A4U1B251_9GAMM|nr:AGE family epimerase/isomerase [Thalassotalea mangrovi]TKB43548.1 mannose-6-phosphate isomerase [Thalassotalea mangrovi]
MSEQLDQQIKRYASWLKEKSVPLWATKGMDKRGGSIERFTSDGDIDLTTNKRVRVQARQMFVFSAAHQQGWINNGLPLIAELEHYVNTHAYVEGQSLYAHLLNCDNKIIDPRFDLYDIAFFLLAYAWRYRVFNDLNALAKADQLLNQIDTHLKGSPGGWMEGNYVSEYRRQNPHMHLFEAFITLYDVTRNGKWLAKAGEIYCLFETQFFDHQSGTLREYFNNDWSLLHDEMGDIVEPGHMLEWVWLLRQYQRLTQAPVNNYCDRLYNKAIEIGLDPKDGLLFDAVDKNGHILKSTKRCWPVTEWIKASLAQAHYHQSDHKQDIHRYLLDASRAIDALMTHFCDPNGSGYYIDQRGADGQVLSDVAPASTLYHLVLAGLESEKFARDHL